MKIILTEAQYKRLIMEQSTFKCIKGNCKTGDGESTDNDGTFIGEFKDGKKWNGIQSGAGGDKIFKNGKIEILRKPNEKSGGIVDTIFHPYSPTGVWVDQLPVNAKTFIKDLAGSVKMITEKDFSAEDLKVLKDIVGKVKKSGRTRLVYSDYDKDSKHSKDSMEDQKAIIDAIPDKKLYQWVDEETGKLNRILGSDLKKTISGSGWSISRWKREMNIGKDQYKGSYTYKSFTDALYRLETTLGRATIGMDKKGNTIIVDEYNFNNGGELNSKTEVSVLDILDANVSNYQKVRDFATKFGSGEGEGAPVYINLGKVAVNRDSDISSYLNKYNKGYDPNKLPNLPDYGMDSAPASVKNLPRQ